MALFKESRDPGFPLQDKSASKSYFMIHNGCKISRSLFCFLGRDKSKDLTSLFADKV